MLDLVVESGLKPYDYNALIPVVRAAGGTIGDWRGSDDFGRGRSSLRQRARFMMRRSSCSQPLRDVP